METYLDLTAGLHTDFEPINQPEKSYRYLLNGIRQLSGAIENEKGTNQIYKFAKSTMRIVGSYVLGTDIIICSTNSLDSEIGVIDKTLTYTTIKSNQALNFSLNSIVKIEGKVNSKGQRIIYLVEKNGTNPMRTINIDDSNLLGSATFIDDIKLQVNPIPPTINAIEVVDGGSLPTSIYQATARLLTSSTNATEFGPVSSLVSIIDDPLSSTYDQQDGAPPQSPSNKAINFSITDIDTSYSYIEVAILTYVGTANILAANIVARLPIDGRSNIQFTYSSLSQNKGSIDLESVTVKSVLYDKAETIAQKDGILTLGNVTSTSEQYNFQSIANAIVVRYKVEEVSYYPGYKDPLLVANKKGYQRDEVYSLAIVPDFINQSTSTAYHIPGNGLSSVADTTTRKLGGYISTEDYPANKDYPTGKVIHHKMPTIQQEPLLNASGSSIRILGLELDMSSAIALIPSNILSNIRGFKIVRQIRGEEDKSILTQGIANPHYQGGGPTQAYAGNIVQLSPVPKYLTTSSSNSNSLFLGGTPFPKLVGFYSPETVIYQSGLTGNLNLNVVGQLEGTQLLVHDRRTRNNSDGEFANFNLFLDYTKQTTVTASSTQITIGSLQYIQADTSGAGFGNTNQSTISGDAINTYKTNGYLFFKLPTNLPIKEEGYTFPGAGSQKIPEFFYQSNGPDSTDKIYLNGVESDTLGGNNKGITNRYLYNISRTLTRQYGSVYDAKYIVCGYYKLDTANYLTQVFGGDTFIGKFGVVSAGTRPSVGGDITYKILSYYFSESTINVDYRHYNQPIGTEGQTDFVPGTTPYYPKLGTLYSDPKDTSKAAGILNLSAALGHGRGYNKQYSFENSILVFYPKQLAEETITKFSNRVIYSVPGVEGEQIDNYRVFLPNNYHDIPRDKGEITELFVLDHKYYIHTSGSLYLSSFNDRVAQTSSAGDVYLGNGGVFSRPSEPILTMNGGYAGTTSSCGVNTPYGRLFTDNLNSKVYLLRDNLDEISAKGMIDFFDEEIIDVDDTPSIGSGYIATYDAYNFRILLTKVGEWTISYSPELNSWSSFHSYKPYHYIHRNNKVLSASTDGIYENNVGSFGKYYESGVSPLQLDIVLNNAAQATKTFDNLKFFTTAKNSDEIEQHYDTFNTLQCYNNRQNTGKCTLVVPKTFEEDFQSLGLFECFAKLKSNEFRVSILNDLVLDVSKSIFDSTNLADSRAYRPSMSGKYMVISLAYDNLRNNYFVLHNIGRIFRQRIR